MILKYCLVLWGIGTGNASFNISYPDKGLGICINKILSSIKESDIFTSDVSLTESEDIVVQSVHGVKGARFITRSQSWENNDVYNNIYMMNFNNFSAMKHGFNVVLEDNYWNPFSNFIIVLEHFDKNLTNIMTLLVFNNIYNVTILGKEGDDYAIYSFHSPIRPCNNRQRLVRISQCSEYDGGSHIFPTMTINELRGCRFKLAAHNIFPMLNMDDNRTVGYEQKMVKLFGERYNLVVELKEKNKIDRFERVVGNYSYVGMLDLVRAGKVEGAIGGYFLDVSILGKFSFTYPLLIDHMLRVMPRADLLNPWLAVYTKSCSVLIFISSLIIIFSILAYLLGLFPSRDKDSVRDFMIVFGYFLNKITVDKMKKGIPETLLLSLLLFSAFMLPYTIQAFLSSADTHPIIGFEVKDAEDIDDSYRLMLPLKWKNINNIIIKNQTCHNLLDCLSAVTNCKGRKHYTMMSSITYHTYKWMLRNGRCGADSYTLREPVYSMLRTVYLRSGSVLGKHFDKFMFTFVASGLRKKHIDDIIFKARLNCRDNAKSSYAALTLQRVRPAFAVLVGGCTLSIVCLVFEVLANKRF